LINEPINNTGGYVNDPIYLLSITTPIAIAAIRAVDTNHMISVREIVGNRARKSTPPVERSECVLLRPSLWDALPFATDTTVAVAQTFLVDGRVRLQLDSLEQLRRHQLRKPDALTTMPDRHLERSWCY